MNPPLVSVAIATWNGARYLREQLETIYLQSWANLEVVVSDDASTDDTAAILQEYAGSRGLQYSINPVRLGLVGNFERAISLCRGDFIALADQDDLWKPEKIERLVESLGDFTLIYCNPQEVLGPDDERTLDTSTQQVIDFARGRGTGRLTRSLLAENWVVSHTMLFRRELVAQALPIPPHQPYHDGWLALVASKLGGIKYLDLCLQTYRQHPASLTYVDPAERGRPRRRLRAFLQGRFHDDWRRRCEHEMARLEDARGLDLLENEDRAFLADLSTYYGSGLRRGPNWRAFASGRRIAPWVATLHGRPKWKFALRGLIGGRSR
jgi:glycosyltransferase involved in cell wall biosynthesis